jgi:DNA-binding CsgD family transcriptional regulator
MSSDADVAAGGACLPATAGSAWTPAQFGEVIGAIYEGPFEQPLWSSALTRIQHDLQAYWSTLVLRPATRNQPALIVIAGLGSVFVGTESEYSSYGRFSLDPFANLPLDKVMTIDEFVGHERWIKSEFYQQFVKPRGIRYTLGADMRTRNDIECRLRVCRLEGAMPFSADDRAYCQALLPHFKRAVYVHSRLDVIESEHKLFASAIEGMHVGTVILDEDGAILKTTHIADQILAEKDGLRAVHGQIACVNAAENRELQQVIRGCLSSPFGTPAASDQVVAITRSSGRGRLGLLVRPIPLGEWSEGQHRPAAVIFVRDEVRGAQPSQATVMRLFDLTPAEATLALTLANGATLDEAAEQIGIRRNTARAHLRSIFAKVGVTRQTMLVRAILNSVASISDAAPE